MTDQEFLDALKKCVKCGGCNADCPTYTTSNVETRTARGRIRLLFALFEGDIGPTKKLNEKIFSCILCGECARVCPLQIDILEVFYHARKLLKKHDTKRHLIRIVSKLAFKNTNYSVHLLKPLKKTVNNILVKKRIIPEGIELRENLLKQTSVYNPKEKIGRVAVFIGCSVKHLYPELSFSLIEVLNALQYEVVFPSAEVCCGAPFRGLGMEKTAIYYAEKNYRIFAALNVDAIISLCPTCIIFLKKYYPRLIGKTLTNVMDISSFLIDKIDNFKNQLSLRIVYHEPCHMLNILQIEREPRELIYRTGTTLMEPGKQNCCGFGGTFSISHSELSGMILENTVNEIKKTDADADADAIVTTCPNCIFQLSKSIQNLPIYHLIELIEESYCQG